MNAVTNEPGEPGNKNCCRKCEREALQHLSPFGHALNRSFIVCPLCGNKRCPKATDHDLECTQSNEPGQPGSEY